ncbi:MAG: biotin/lipoyl-containing protein, partial [Bacteroidota bacterium]
FSVASSLEAARAGADYIDVGMEPLSWGTGHADLLTVHAMLDDAGFAVPEINLNAYMEARSLTQSFMDDFLGYYINPRNRKMNSLLIGPGLPGGMMGSLMADLENNLRSLNKWLTKRNKPTITQDELLIRLFDEVKYIWPQLGYPPLVTPYSQYTKNTALMNVLQMAKGRERWSLLDENTWGMILGKSGSLPGQLGEEILKLAEEQNREFFQGSPQDLYPDNMEEYRKKMEEKGWELGPDEEELFEYAMHPPQYENYKSGKAKADFLADLEKRKEAAHKATAPAAPAAAPASTGAPAPKSMWIDVDGERFKVQVSYDLNDGGTTEEKASEKPAEQPASNAPADAKDVISPLEGTFYLTMNSADRPVKIGDRIETGQVIFYIESMKVMNAVKAEVSGEVVQISVNNGDAVDEDDVIMKVK